VFPREFRFSFQTEKKTRFLFFEKKKQRKNISQKSSIKSPFFLKEKQEYITKKKKIE